jgi:hypothetical protein
MTYTPAPGEQKDVWRLRAARCEANNVGHIRGHQIFGI